MNAVPSFRLFRSLAQSTLRCKYYALPHQNWTFLVGRRASGRDGRFRGRSQTASRRLARFCVPTGREGASSVPVADLEPATQPVYEQMQVWQRGGRRRCGYKSSRPRPVPSNRTHTPFSSIPATRTNGRGPLLYTRLPAAITCCPVAPCEAPSHFSAFGDPIGRPVAPWRGWQPPRFCFSALPPSYCSQVRVQLRV